MSETRRIGDGQRFALPAGVCEESRDSLAIAEKGQGTARHDVGWYTSNEKTVGVARYDWTDATTFDHYRVGFLRDITCLEGEADQRFELSGSTVTMWLVRTGPDSAAAVGVQLLVSLDGTMLSIHCDFGAVASCRGFASELLATFKVA